MCSTLGDTCSAEDHQARNDWYGRLLKAQAIKRTDVDEVTGEAGSSIKALVAMFLEDIDGHQRRNIIESVYGVALGQQDLNQEELELLKKHFPQIHDEVCISEPTSST